MRITFLVLLALGALAFSGISTLADVIEVEVEDNTGAIYEIEQLNNEIKVFTDRDHIFKDIPAKYTDGSYTFIRCPVQSVREMPDIDITFDLPVSCRVYVLWYKQGDWAKPHDPTDWLKEDYRTVEGDVFVWGPQGGADLNYEVWQSKEVCPPGEFHTYTSGNDCAYTVFITAESQAVDSSGKLLTTWGEIRQNQ
jgi:hypothetical protein